MSEILGTIKFLEGRIITNRNGVTETWSTGGGDSNYYIVHNGTTYRLLNGKGEKTELVSKKKYEEIEEDEDLDIDDFY
jgi:hypothetical protein